MKIGVLALQGAFREHIKAVEKLGYQGVEIRKPEQMDDVQGLIIPGGESTTIGKLMVDFGLMDVIKEKAKQGMGLFGTCAGMILLAKDIQGSEQPRLGLVDMVVKRNAYGRQIDSFETDLPIGEIGEVPVKSVFIRAPYIEKVGKGVSVLATFEDKIVCVRQGKILAASFHPELTDDYRLHEYFIKNCCS